MSVWCFQLVLAMGNYMNKGNMRIGAAAGFKIEYLNKVSWSSPHWFIAIQFLKSRPRPRAKRVFPKRSSNRRNFKTPACRFTLDRIHFENEAFRKRRRHFNHVISVPESSSNTNPKWSVICASRLLNTVAHAKLTRLAYFFILYSIFSFLFSVRTYVC